MPPIIVATCWPSSNSPPGAAATTPVASMPSTRGNVTPCATPRRVCSSERLIPNALTRMSTQPARGSGTARSRIRSASGGPGASSTTARMVALLVWVSAKRAVDDDFVQRALEMRELPIVELSNEQLRDPAGMDGRRLTETGHARLGERHYDAAGVGACCVPADEAFIHQPGDAAGHARPRDERPIRQLCDAQLTVGLRQLSEHVEVGQGQPRLSLQIRIQSAHERGVRPQQRAPGLQPTPARHLVLDEP